MTVTDMRTVSQRLAPALAHFFNHQTHHRGPGARGTDYARQTAPSLDLIYFQRTAGRPARSPEGQAMALSQLTIQEMP